MRTTAQVRHNWLHLDSRDDLLDVETQPRLHDRVRGILHNRASRESLCKIHIPVKSRVVV